MTFAYTSQNRLAFASGATTSSVLYADSLERLDYIGATTTQLAHDGGRVVSEMVYNGGMAPVARRYVHGPGVDEPLVWYEGAGTSDRRWLHADET